MAGFRSFEEIEGWKLARVLARRTYRLTRTGRFHEYRDLRYQLRKTVRSVMSNIAEGFGRGTDREFMRFLSIARGSGSELKSDLYLCLDEGLLSEPEFRELSHLVSRVIGAVAALTRSIRSTTAAH